MGMMNEIKTLEDESVVTTTMFVSEDDQKSFYMEERFNSGVAIVDRDWDEDYIQESADPYADPLDVTAMDLEDLILDDPIDVYFYSDDMTDLEIEEITKIWETEGILGIESRGFEIDGTETLFYGPLMVEEKY